MNLHEYQSKHLLSEFKIPVPVGEVVDSTHSAVEVAKKLGGHRWVVKAQVHAGGRGKAGGVKIVDNLEDLERVVKKLLGTRLVTHQTDERGQPVNQIYIEKPSAIKKELYFSALVDRSSQQIIFMASTEGGMEIEQVAEESPEKILKVAIDPVVGFQPYQARQLFFGLKLDIDLLHSFTQMLSGIYQCFIKNDLSLLEINPLVITEDNQLICLDAKINVDDNALYRQIKIREMRDTSQEDERETRAQQWDLNYIALDGDIGCMVNGAGLAMATMDLIKLQGGRPANFLDVGGSATQERVTEAFKIIVSDRNVRGIFVNIFGGIVRCDLIATGIINAVNEVGVSVPVVVRLQGNNADKGAKLLVDSGLNILAVQNFSDAAKKIVSLVKEKE